ncbi:hypothetical protein ACFO5O_11130 [Geojedonia litorea]|uniref:Membrane protein involved in the export of O-antigen and teichoic acid n=1 Tax=Geojedonia litorea TaxID=1268269 RepID=A0ABV9N3N3_9FLAO
MLKKLLIIALIVATGHFLSVFSISFIVKRGVDAVFLENVTNIESTLALIIAIIAFGLQQITTRDIVVSQNWKLILEKTQAARFTLGILLALFGILAFLVTETNFYLIFLVSPIIAYVSDYALYARGLAIEGSFISLIRVTLPSLALILMGIVECYSIGTYYIIIFITFAVVVYVSNKILNFKIKLNADRHFYKLYAKNVNIGLTDITITVLQLGILSIATPFYKDQIVTDTFLVLKIYVLLKGVQRLIFQAFYKDLVSLDKSLLIDKLIFISGFVFFVICTLYPSELIELIYSKEYFRIEILFKIIGVAALVSSVLIASSARTLLLKREKEYTFSYILSLIITIISVLLFSFNYYGDSGIALSILAGELTLFFCFSFFLKTEFQFKKRFMFYLPFLFMFLIFFLLKENFTFLYSSILTLLILIIYGCYYIYTNKELYK